ncbi:hypothetical protein [Spiroplasma endosymbiont of Agriotes lineatus]|uniref:hypothetical protein n=1 Tax=Spiroplasma endosymbiont of Agriotes lineatus TaxID=3077930 RepID=UPI0030D5FBCC
MKKLLGLLSTITIASSGIVGIVANSHYEKQEQKTKLENNKINNLQIKYNLENLIRAKRNLNSKEEIIRITNSDWHISSLAVDSQNNVYFGTRLATHWYICIYIYNWFIHWKGVLIRCFKNY